MRTLFRCQMYLIATDRRIGDTYLVKNYKDVILKSEGFV